MKKGKGAIASTFQQGVQKGPKGGRRSRGKRAVKRGRY